MLPHLLFSWPVAIDSQPSLKLFEMISWDDFQIKTFFVKKFAEIKL